MKKLAAVVSVMAILALGMTFYVGQVSAASGPAPNSGDGISDGSGLDSPNGPVGEGNSDTGNGSNGPAPNSGDGVPDGSGMDSPNGPNG